MCLSMTGFSSSEFSLRPEASDNSMQFSVEIKTLNSRFFEATCKLPSALGAFESQAISLMRKKLLRGRVFLAVRFVGNAEAMERLVVSRNIASEYVREANLIGAELGISSELTVSQIMHLPHILVFERLGLAEGDEKRFFEALETTIDGVVETRIDEGNFLRDDLGKRISVSLELIDKVKTRNVVMVNELKPKVSELSSQVQNGDVALQNRLEDMKHLLDKIDVHEEISRFKAHIKSVKVLLAADLREKGKKLDFISQELLRETNTLAAKCSDYEIAALAVDIKVELEKVREQAQNVV